MHGQETLERIRMLREEIASILETSRDYLSRSRHTQEETRLHQNREARLVAIREEIASLTSK
jgi:hypothetical protein